MNYCPPTWKKKIELLSSNLENPKKKRKRKRKELLSSSTKGCIPMISSILALGTHLCIVPIEMQSHVFVMFQHPNGFSALLH